MAKTKNTMLALLAVLLSPMAAHADIINFEFIVNIDTYSSNADLDWHADHSTFYRPADDVNQILDHVNYNLSFSIDTDSESATIYAGAPFINPDSFYDEDQIRNDYHQLSDINHDLSWISNCDLIGIFGTCGRYGQDSFTFNGSLATGNLFIDSFLLDTLRIATIPELSVGDSLMFSHIDRSDNSFLYEAAESFGCSPVPDSDECIPLFTRFDHLFQEFSGNAELVSVIRHSVPEPSTIALLIIGLLGMGIAKKRVA